jgi:hypothetical protein
MLDITLIATAYFFYWLNVGFVQWLMTLSACHRGALEMRIKP